MRIVRCVKPIARMEEGKDYAAVWNGARWEIYETELVWGTYLAHVNCLSVITDRMFENHFDSVDWKSKSAFGLA